MYWYSESCSAYTTPYALSRWTAFNEPDHTGEQRRALQGMLLRMVSGTLSIVGDNFQTQAAGAQAGGAAGEGSPGKARAGRG